MKKVVIATFLPSQVGHQDFYPSGGRHQISCPGLLNFICDHFRSVDFFTESITTKCKWRAYKCSSWVRFKLVFCRKCGDKGCPRMGYFADPSKGTGEFMLGTNKKEPYCRNDSGQPPRLRLPSFKIG
ncbi:Pancreatic lipase-related protein 3 [Holothuria leucospilota]|uniref:Pancreatic lipase-related protein 3 n=1 Tax=Holothuria leucospilota TaxID=206669 RepID=A0A9Q1BA58_HOLLE|nr:Pancreatic lipase-related protein 3 [Holothuria leucospilota]